MARVLGVNSAYHDHAACLVVDGELVAMAEEERFNRVRHGKRARVDNPDDLPERAMAFCLAQGGLDWSDLDAVGWSLDPDARLAANRRRQRSSAEGWGTEDGELTFHRHNLAARDALRTRAPQAAFRFLPHHLCHAASAYLVSPFEQAAVLVVDGIGESGSAWLGRGAADLLTELETVDYPHSVGFVWEKMSELLGFDAYAGPGKLMGYGAITDPRGERTGADHLAALLEIFRPEPGGTFFVDDDAFRFATEDFTGLERRFGPRRARVVDRYEDASIAAALQAVTDEVMVHLARRLYDRVNEGRTSPVTDLCLAGGVALNCVSNYQVALRAGFRRIWVQPAANDAGTALGAAVLLHQELGGRRPRMREAYLGPGYDDDRLAAALDAAGLARTSPADLEVEVARRVDRGEIIAWFEGRQEVGPRALGHRSILADPTRFDTRSRLNSRVKLRESFRPFAPAVLPEAIDRFFERPAELLGAEYMLFALPLRDRRDLQVLPAVVQENGSTGLGTSRVQVVHAARSPRFARVISELAARNGVPAVLNTSFNIGEPIVTSPEEAIATFLRSSMDALALGPWLVSNPRRP